VPHIYRSTTKLSFVIPRACDFFDLSAFLHAQPDVFNLLHKIVILRACDFFDLSVFLPTQPDLFKPSIKPSS
jgi:hypothetical protein